MLSLDAILVLLGGIAFTSLAAPRLRIPLPLALTATGLAIALVPRIEHPRLHPDFVLYVILPPLLYADAFHTSWNDFRRWLRPILSLAVALVALTILAVGLADGYSCDLPITQAEIADATGLSTVHVNRTLQELRADRLISLKGTWLDVLDWQRLKQAGDFDPAYLHLNERSAALV